MLLDDGKGMCAPGQLGHLVSNDIATHLEFLQLVQTNKHATHEAKASKGWETHLGAATGPYAYVTKSVSTPGGGGDSSAVAANYPLPPTKLWPEAPWGGGLPL